MNDKVSDAPEAQSQVEQAVAEGAAYDVIRKRLNDQGGALRTCVDQLNQDRLTEFGSSEMQLVGRTRIRTEHNCVARDIVQVGSVLIFGYNVFMGLKRETQMSDVFSIMRLVQTEEAYEIEAVDVKNSFMGDTRFQNDFDELYRYYKNTRLIKLTHKQDKLLAGFQIGERLEDIRVFRWSVSADQQTIEYIDNRGERDFELPPIHDFEWTSVTREDQVNGRHPHVNILDTLFVETIGGDLTIKIEDNTESGLGIYSEPVEDATQSLDDAQIDYAAVGNLILLKMRPYRETEWRHFIYNKLLESVQRVDAIGESCVRLPEDHGVIFPGGLYLESGEYKYFDNCPEGLKFKRTIKSPNGEDVLFIFYEPLDGLIALFPYNLISRSLQNPIYGHGYALAENGRIVIFNAEDQATRVHPIQVWDSPYQSAEFASQAPANQSALGRIGNSELVRGISDLYSLCKMIDSQQASSTLYVDMEQSALKMFDNHYWLAEAPTQKIADTVRGIAQTAAMVLDEFEKVESIRTKSNEAMADAKAKQQDLMREIQPESWETPQPYVEALTQIRQQRGHLMTIREYRYIDLNGIDQLDTELADVEQSLAEQTVQFLSDATSLQHYHNSVADIDAAVGSAETVADLTPHLEKIEQTAAGLDLLSELVGTLKVADTTQRTAIVDTISMVYGQLNQSRARARQKEKQLGSAEAVEQFGAQFKLFSQSVANALSLSDSPDKCDEQLSRLVVQLEELESQFSEYDEFLSDILAKREEVYEAFEGLKQRLVDEQQRKAQNFGKAASRILESIEKRSLKFTEADALNTYFASDSLISKLRELIESLSALDASVQADEIQARFKAIKEQAIRGLRDKSDLYSEGGAVVKLGPRHRFSVNTQNLDITLLPGEDHHQLSLVGTNYREILVHPELDALKAYWHLQIESENDAVYRAEYLAFQVVQAAQNQAEGLTMTQLNRALPQPDVMMEIVRKFAGSRYREGYTKGVHDHDACEILLKLLPALTAADLLRYDPFSRAFAQGFWASELAQAQATEWRLRARSAQQLQTVFEAQSALNLLEAEITEVMTAFDSTNALSSNALQLQQAAAYLVAELSRDSFAFVQSQFAAQLVGQLRQTLEANVLQALRDSLQSLQAKPAAQWHLAQAWLEALVVSKDMPSSKRYVPEAVVALVFDTLPRYTSQVDVEVSVSGLLGEHVRLQSGSMDLAVDTFLSRLNHHVSVSVPEYQRYLSVRQSVLDNQRQNLRLDEFKPKPLSSFVRNRLINECYLPIIGDNLAKQMGTAGESRRTDLMGLLMMISPPGYGKTTLMEYVASRLGLIFMKINCPSLGHQVTALDPAQAPDATAARELEKLNLALEMGNNVMLYLDDIQHTDPEFLQKFISLCDGTRRIDGVWRGQTKTYDLRGRKFCVVMAGNPYTESGEVFKIPDMLANRADIYNLGDILGGMEVQFALSYIENALTSNSVLAPLAVREMSDVYQLIDLAQGKQTAADDIKHPYSAAELNEIVQVLQKLFVIQDVVLKINQEYIASAAQDDKYRTEPPFKLQGSYRNMNKMAEKVSAVMTQDELMQLIEDHYQGEAQLLTAGAEANLLKLAELRGNLTEDQNVRWSTIKETYARNMALGGDGADAGSQIVLQLTDVVKGINTLGQSLGTMESATARQGQLNLKQRLHASKLHQQQLAAQSEFQTKLLAEQPAGFDRLVEALSGLMQTLAQQRPEVDVQVVNEPVPGVGKMLGVMAQTLETSLYPLMRSLDKKLEIDLKNHEKMQLLVDQMRQLQSDLGSQKASKSTKSTRGAPPPSSKA